MDSKRYLERLFGIKSGEFRTVGLFLLHNFLLGIGSILVYVTANVLLLEHDPARSLPLGYIAGALAMMVVGKVYTHFEHHLLLKKLAGRVLAVVLVLTGLVGVLVVAEHAVAEAYPVATAVAIVAGYRVIYLLTNLEFWGISAVVFDVRQSKRLFSIISAGDMPAKALGAVLAALLHSSERLPVLLAVAFGAYLGAALVLRATLRTHTVEATERPVRLNRPAVKHVVEQLFGGSELVLAMCLSLVAIAGVLTGVEYLFFLNVKLKFHDSSAIMHSVGWVLGGTYLVAMLFKLLISGKVLDRYGVQWCLRLLPVVALGCLVGFEGWQAAKGSTPALLLAFFCGLYLLLEVLRRTVFDPVFLVLFQALAPLPRLGAHTLAKGFYEPLGMGLTGALFFALHAGHLEKWAPYLWMGSLLVAALLLLHYTYRSYLAELREGLSRRFADTTDIALPEAARHVVLAQLLSPRASEVLNAMAWLREREPHMLATQAATLLEHPDERVRLALLAVPEANALPPEGLAALALRDADPAVRQVAARLLAATPAAPALSSLLQGTDWPARQGALAGILAADPTQPAARRSLAELLTHPQPEPQTTALALLAWLPAAEQAALVTKNLTGPNPAMQQAALSALGTVPGNPLTQHLLPALADRDQWPWAADSLVALGSAALPLVQVALAQAPDKVLTYRLVAVLERLDTTASRQMLLALAEAAGLVTRGLALRALRRTKPLASSVPTLGQLLSEEFALAARLLRGELAMPALAATLAFERTQLVQRVFGLLAQLYDAEAVATAQRNVAHAGRERQANALEILDNLVPHTIYQGLQALLDDTTSAATKVPLLTTLGGHGRTSGAALATTEPDEPITTFLLRAGPDSFTPWTLGLVLRHWQPGTPDDQALLQPYLTSPDLLLRECGYLAAQALATSRKQPLATLFPALAMSHSPATNRISALERVEVLKNTALFAHTPENVLSSIVPIMKEVSFHDGQEIFAKGDVGTSLFIVFDGQVGIFNGPQQLATFGAGDFFGELALLDTEPRSATATALDEVLAFRIDQDDFYDLMEERSEVLRNILQMLCQRIRRQNDRMHELAQQRVG